MTDDGFGRYLIQRQVPSEFPDDYKAHALEVARHEAGMRLYDLVYRVPNPVALEIDEEITKGVYGYDYRQPMDEIRITVKLTKIQRQSMYFASTHGPDDYSIYPPLSLWRKATYKIKDTWHKVNRRLRAALRKDAPHA